MKVPKVKPYRVPKKKRRGRRKKGVEPPYRVANYVGRPTLYSEEAAIKILDQISTTHHGLKTICENDSTLPEVSTIFRWLRDHQEFCDRYDKAKRQQVQVLADEIVQISNTQYPGKIIKIKQTGSGNNMREEKEITQADAYAHRRLQIETRKWLLSKLDPKKYGDRVEVVGNVDPLSDLIKEMRAQNGHEPAPLVVTPAESSDKGEENK